MMDIVVFAVICGALLAYLMPPSQPGGTVDRSSFLGPPSQLEEAANHSSSLPPDPDCESELEELDETVEDEVYS